MRGCLLNIISFDLPLTYKSAPFHHFLAENTRKVYMNSCYISAVSIRMIFLCFAAIAPASNNAPEQHFIIIVYGYSAMSLNDQLCLD